MTRKMTVGAAAAAFFGTILAASAAGVVSSSETTNVWFDAVITNIATGAAKVDLSGVTGWTVPSPAIGEAWATNRTVVFDTDATSPLKFTPSEASGEVALVNVSLVVDPNASLPSTTGLDAAQAALTVVTNDSGLAGVHWVGLVKDGATNKWETLTGDSPTVGATYDVEIALDNRASKKKIRYSVKLADAAAYTVLNTESPVDGGWLNNPQDKSTVTAVGFAGAGTVKRLAGDDIVEIGPTIGDITGSNQTGANGYDFTNGTLTACVTIPSGEYGDKTAVLTVTNRLSGGSSKTYVAEIEGPSVLFNLAELSQGSVYSFDLAIKYDGVTRSVKSGTFVAAGWSDCLFSGEVVNGVTNVVNGVMSGAVVGTDKWSVVTNAQFEVDDTTRGAGTVTRVDTSYSFETFIDTDSLEPLTGAVGGIVAVSNGADPAWYAYTGTNPSELNGWQKLTGDIVPATNTDYVIRAEFDFKSSTHGVCYYVAVGNSGSFCPLTLGSDIMIGLAKTTNTLSSVEMSGKGFVKSICANIADVSVAEVNGTKYTSLWEAVKAANGGTITLLTNATLKPEGVTGGKFPFKLKGGDYILDKSGVSGAWKVVKKGGVLYLMKPAATYIFF